MNPINISGCGTALITPFVDGAVDYEAYRKTIEWQVAEKIHFLVALGTTAETPCLTDEEKIKLLHITKQYAPGTPVVAGVGTNSPTHTLHNIQLLDEADAFLVVVPYYNKPTQEGMYRYFKTIAESTDKPIVLYNVPGRTAVNMSAATTLRLAEIDNIVAIKEASGNIEQIRTIIDNAPDGFKVLSGNDDQTLDIISLGGHGVISVASNVAPAMMRNLAQRALDGDFNTAIGLMRKLMPLFDACFVESNPIPVKGALNLLGLCSDEMRLPLVACSDDTKQLMKKVLTRLELL